MKGKGLDGSQTSSGGGSEELFGKSSKPRRKSQATRRRQSPLAWQTNRVPDGGIPSAAPRIESSRPRPVHHPRVLESPSPVTRLPRAQLRLRSQQVALVPLAKRVDVGGQQVHLVAAEELFVCRHRALTTTDDAFLNGIRVATVQPNII